MLQDAFIRIPKILMADERFAGLSNDALMLFGLLDDRTRLSAANGWHDENGEVFIFFPIQEICEKLKCRTEKACRLMSALEKAGLIRKRPRGRGLASMIYVDYPQTDTTSTIETGRFDNRNEIRLNEQA